MVSTHETHYIVRYLGFSIFYSEIVEKKNVMILKNLKKRKIQYFRIILATSFISKLSLKIKILF